MTLPREERETIINFDETPDDALVFTYNTTWQKHIEDRLSIAPRFSNGFGAKEYQIPKKQIPMPRVPRKMTGEQKQRAAERLAEHRQGLAKVA